MTGVQTYALPIYEDGFHKFFDANNPPQARAKVLHTPTVLNVAIAADRFIQLCGEKLTAAGGEIWDETEFQRSEIFDDGTFVTRSEEHTSELQSLTNLVCRLLLEKKKPISYADFCLHPPHDPIPHVSETRTP